jgi:hypothetical protein
MPHKMIENIAMIGLAGRIVTLQGDGWIGRWSPGIGDPTVMGWLTVALYALGAWNCFRVVTRHSNLLRPGESRLWWILFYGLLALGINKQLDLQSALTEIGRILAEQQDWYDKRHEVQKVFIYSITAFAAFSTFLMAFLARKAPIATRIALTGCICLISFVVIRAASFHHFDIFIDRAIFGLKMNSILEMGGICIIIAGARLRLQSR